MCGFYSEVLILAIHKRRPIWTGGDRFYKGDNTCTATRTELNIFIEVEYERGNICKFLKEAWDTLTLAYEGMSHVTDSKKNMLIQKNIWLFIERK
ncbi:hypothetical protein CR513_25819, partial [Mucuna pruriens]